MKRTRNRFGNAIYYIAGLSALSVFAFMMLFGVLIAAKNGTLLNAELENGYRQAFFNMADNVNSIEINLSKLLVLSNEEQIIEACDEIRLSAQSAQDSVSILPLNEHSAYDLNKFLNQIGEWTACYKKAILSNGELSCFDDKIEEIYTVASEINSGVEGILHDLQREGGSIARSIKRSGIKNVGDFSALCQRFCSENISYTELVYDGMFSDTDGERCFKALEGLPIISEEDALVAYSSFFKDLGVEKIELIGKSSEPSTYDFKGSTKDAYMFFSITEHGGKLYSVNTELFPLADKGEETINWEESGRGIEEELAIFYAQKCGYKGELIPIRYSRLENRTFISLAPLVDGVIYYPDLIKVKLESQSRRLLGLEASGFCSYSCCRELVCNIDESMAKSAVSPKLEIIGCKKVLIPSSFLARGNGCAERLCFEVECEYKDLDYYIYIDAVTGKEIAVSIKEDSLK